MKRNFISSAYCHLRFHLMGLATIKGIPTYEFRDLIKTLKSEGWYVTYEYYGEDAWVHYAQVKLRHDLRRLTLEWMIRPAAALRGLVILFSVLPTPRATRRLMSGAGPERRLVPRVTLP